MAHGDAAPVHRVVRSERDGDPGAVNDQGSERITAALVGGAYGLAPAGALRCHAEDGVSGDCQAVSRAHGC